LVEVYLHEHQIPFNVFHAYSSRPCPPLTSYKTLFIGGTPLSVNEMEQIPFLMDEFTYLRQAMEAGKDLFGICFGAQFLAKLLGAEVRKNPVREIGIYHVNLTPSGINDPLFRGFPEIFPVFHWHGDTFEIPHGLKNLMSTETCKNQAFRLGNRVGLQFHLEVTSREASNWSVKYREELLQSGRNASRIIQEFHEAEEEMKRLAFLLLDNFFNLS